MKRVLVIQKTSVYGQLLEAMGASRVSEVLKTDDALRGRCQLAHDENSATINTIREVLSQSGVSSFFHERPEIPPTDDFDLVITVGGDGTFLDVSHAVGDVPMLGINSSLSSSVGHFCCANLHDFAEVFDSIVGGRLKPKLLYRLQVEVNGDAVATLALNEVLFTHQIPAGTSRYQITVGDRVEQHKSSGVWISTASGATGAIMSAGGSTRPQDARTLQYLVREPYLRGDSSAALLAGYSHDPIRIRATSSHSALFIDGPGERVNLDFGAKVVFRPGARPLLTYQSSDSGGRRRKAG